MYPSSVISILRYKPKSKLKKIKKYIHSANSFSTSSSEDSLIDSSNESDHYNDNLDSISSSPSSGKSRHSFFRDPEEVKLVHGDISQRGRQLVSRSSGSSALGSDGSCNSSSSSSQSKDRGYIKHFKKFEHFNFLPLFLDDSKLD